MPFARDSQLTTQYSCYCDTCGQTCYGIRLACLNCLENVTAEASYDDTVDFDTFECAKTTIHPKPYATKTPHTPSHDLLKVRTIVSERDLPVAYKRAKLAADACRDHFAPTMEHSQGDQGDKITEAATGTIPSDQPTGEFLSVIVSLLLSLSSLQRQTQGADKMWHLSQGTKLTLLVLRRLLYTWSVRQHDRLCKRTHACYRFRCAVVLV